MRDISNVTTDELKPWVTVGDAFSDLPEVFPTADSKYKLVSLNIEYPYKTEAQNEYQKIMRTWYGKEGFGVSANAFRRNTRDFPIFERMQQGDNYMKRQNFLGMRRIVRNTLVSIIKWFRNMIKKNLRINGKNLM